jgi:hypothetical protein
MRSIAAFAVCAAFSVTYARFAIAGEQSQAGSTPSPQVPGFADELHFVTVLTLRGKVVAVDPANRRVTVKDSKGDTSSLEVRSEKALDSLKAGDRVVVRYFEGAQIRKKKATKAGPNASLNDGIIGGEPGGPSKKKHALVASVEAVDAMDQEVTLKGAGGSIETIMVVNPENLGHITVGDQVVITRAQALALSVEKEG